MANLPWLEDTNYRQPMYSRMDMGQGGGSSMWDYLMSQQPTAPQSLATALPFLRLPKKQAAYFQPFNNTVAAMQDPNSAQFQNVYKQQQAFGQQNLADSIAEMVRQNRKQGRLGRTPLFNPERGGETLFRGVNKGYQDIQNQAFDKSYNILGNTATLQNQQAMQMSQLAGNKAGVKGNLLGMLTKLFGL